jgi:hypothetical protein
LIIKVFLCQGGRLDSGFPERQEGRRLASRTPLAGHFKFTSPMPITHRNVLPGKLNTHLQPLTHGQRNVCIARAFNLFAEKISDILLQIRAISESVNVASAEITQGNQDLSRRTEHAASSLQETAAALEEIAGTARNSADAATQVSRHDDERDRRRRAQHREREAASQLREQAATLAQSVGAFRLAQSGAMTAA